MRVFVLSVALPAVKDMNVYDETSGTMRVRWEEADGATGYMLLYKSINATEPQLEKEVTLFSLQMKLVGFCSQHGKWFIDRHLLRQQ